MKCYAHLSLLSLQDGLTGLHIAAYNGADDVIEQLLKKGALTDLQDKVSAAKLIFAFYDIYFVHAHYSSEGNLTYFSQDGNTPLHYASMVGHVTTVQMLQAHGASAAIKNKVRDL